MVSAGGVSGLRDPGTGGVVTRDQLRASLTALQVQIDGLIRALEEPAPARPEPGTAECPHPDESRVNASTMGRPRRFYCQACKQYIDE
jgi:hypothetical protein